MDDSFFAYLQQLELMAFFSGYPLIYAIALFIAGKYLVKNNLNTRVVSLLPFGYALVGTLFLGFQLKKLYPDYSIENIKLTIHQPLLIIYGLLSLLFWIPAISKKRSLSFIHSLIFVFFLVRDLFLQLITPSTDQNILKNDINVYLDSILLNLLAFAFIASLSFLYSRYKTPLRSYR